MNIQSGQGGSVKTVVSWCGPMTDSDGFDLQAAIDTAGDAVTEFREFLGVQEEAFTCPDCTTACEPAETYNPDTAAFDGGACPSWYCGECDSHYVREHDDARHTLDLYGQGMD